MTLTASQLTTMTREQVLRFRNGVVLQLRVLEEIAAPPLQRQLLQLQLRKVNEYLWPAQTRLGRKAAELKKDFAR